MKRVIAEDRARVRREGKIRKSVEKALTDPNALAQQYKSQRDKAVDMLYRISSSLADGDTIAGDSVALVITQIQSVIDECSDKIKEEKE